MNRFIKADEVAEELGISKPYAYKIIRRLNEELREKGMICGLQLQLHFYRFSRDCLLIISFNSSTVMIPSFFRWIIR